MDGVGPSRECWQDKHRIHSLLQDGEEWSARRCSKPCGYISEESWSIWSRAQQREPRAEHTAERCRGDTTLTLLQLCHRQREKQLQSSAFHQKSFRLKLFCTAKVIFLKTKSLGNSFGLGEGQLTMV